MTAVPSTLPPTAVQPTATAEAETWSIDFQRTGGIAGLSQSLSIDSAGDARYEDMTSQRVVTGTLDATTLADLRGLIESSGFFAQAPTQTSPCADCFNISIRVSLDNDVHSVEAVDIAADAALLPLIETLTLLLQDGLSQ